MTFLESWKLAVTTLGPVHVGTGDEYDPTGYVVRDHTLYAFDPAGAARMLPPQALERLGQIVGGAPGPDMLRKVQAFVHEHAAELAAAARHALPVAAGVAALYGGRVGRVAQREEGGRQILNKLGIARTFANPHDHRPILPGSSLKGAIRTALLDALNEGRRLEPEETNLLDSPRPAEQARAHRALQQRLFDYRAGKFELDPMRLVQLSDAGYEDEEGLPGTEVLFAVNRKKEAVIKNGEEALSQAERSNLYQVLESVPALRYRAFTGQLNIQRVEEATAAEGKLPRRELRWTAAHVVAACNRFYRPLFQADTARVRRRGFLDEVWSEAVEQLRPGLEERLDGGKAFLLRVGRHSGAEALTLDGVRHVRIMRGRGEEAEYLPHAKTWWLAAGDTDGRRDLVPYGWVLVELAPADKPFTPWPEAQALLRERASVAYAWRDTERARRAGRAAAREREESQRREAEARQAAAEAATRKREALLAAMTEEERKVHELREWLEEDRAAKRIEAGGRLANRAADLLREAEAWPGTARRQLADLIEEVYRLIGWGNARKKEEKKTRLAKLREGSG
jgi:CRISPR-associated protein Csm5